MAEISKLTYEEYLQSEHWKAFSSKVKHDRPACEDCHITASEAYKRDRQGLNVHHLTYENIGKEKPEDVIAVCHYCHLKRHGIQGFYEWTQKFKMPEISRGSQQACANCGAIGGPQYFNVDERLTEWLCRDCR